MKVVAALLLVAALAVPARAEDVRRFGLMLDAGVPDGANASLVFRPAGWFRVHAGGGTNLIAPGVRAGVSLMPLPGMSLNAEGGHYFRGDANGLARMLSGDGTVDVPALRDVGYDYANFHLGLELTFSWLTLYVHGGMSYLHGQVRNIGPTLNQSIGGDGMVTVSEDPTVHAWAASARVGLIVYVLP
ncbi:MAG TPA: hypothetical protein VKH36_06240 [Acidimicrobiia bacterium]|nr:hypothetical protein [Haliangiales bacterium]HMG26400.1 hypothetical protein [Acidimicrobiia bacterium]